MTQLPANLRPDVRRLVDNLKGCRTDMLSSQLVVQPAIYHDKAVAQAERERIFARGPVAVCHRAELAQPGAQWTVRLPNNLTTVQRRSDGSVAAHTPAGELSVEERHGFIWVVDSTAADIDVAGWLGPEMDAIVASYELDKYECFKSEAFEQPVNWKLLQDAFLDGYHLQWVHPKSAGKVIFNNVLTLDDFGRHSRFMSARKSLRPLIADGAPPCSDDDIMQHVNIAHGLLPNATLLWVPDHVELLSFFPHPDDPGHSRMEMRILVKPCAPDADRGAWTRRWERNWSILMDVLCEEDFPIVRACHRALRSAGAGPLLLGRNEVGNQVFHRELSRLLGSP